MADPSLQSPSQPGATSSESTGTKPNVNLPHNKLPQTTTTVTGLSDPQAHCRMEIPQEAQDCNSSVTAGRDFVTTGSPEREPSEYRDEQH